MYIFGDLIYEILWYIYVHTIYNRYKCVVNTTFVWTQMIIVCSRWHMCHDWHIGDKMLLDGYMFCSIQDEDVMFGSKVVHMWNIWRLVYMTTESREDDEYTTWRLKTTVNKIYFKNRKECVMPTVRII